MMSSSAPALHSRAVYLKIEAKLSWNGRPTAQTPGWLVYPRADDYPVVGHWVFRVREDKDGRPFYEGLDVNQAYKDEKSVAGAFEFTVPPADPNDSLLVLAVMRRFPGHALPSESREPSYDWRNRDDPCIPKTSDEPTRDHSAARRHAHGTCNRTVTISGQVLDANGAGVDNVVVSLHFSDGTSSLPYTTPIGGTYQFADVNCRASQCGSSTPSWEQDIRRSTTYPSEPPRIGRCPRPAAEGGEGIVGRPVGVGSYALASRIHPGRTLARCEGLLFAATRCRRSKGFRD